MKTIHISKNLSKTTNLEILQECFININDRIMINAKDIWHKGLLKPEYKNRTLIGTVRCFTKTGKIGIEFDDTIYSQREEPYNSTLYNKSFSSYHNLNERARDFRCTYFDSERKFRVFTDYDYTVNVYKDSDFSF